MELGGKHNTVDVSMHGSALKFQITIAFAAFLTCSLTLCLLTWIAVFQLSIVKKKSPVYLISTGHILADVVMLGTFLFYLIPCALKNDYIFPGGRFGPFGQLAAFCFEFSWIYVTFSQVFMSINRVVVVCFPARDIFNYQAVAITTLCLFPLAAGVSVMTTFVLPCCPIIFNHHLLSYNYVQTSDYLNYSNYFVNSPLNASSSVVSFCCYSYIFYYIRKSSHIAEAGSQQVKKRQRKREIMYSLQFSAISAFHFLEWTSFRILPLLIDFESPEFHPAFIFVGLFVCLNASMNSLVYMVSNGEVRNSLRGCFAKLSGRPHVESFHVISVTPTVK